MKNRVLACINVLLLAILTSLLMPPVAAANPDDEKTTEDVIYMLDGRELHGHILDETRDAVIFQFIDRKINIQTRLTLLKDEIAKIERDVPIEAVAEPKKPRQRIKDPGKETETPEKTYGARRVESANEALPSFYIVPMTGQMGTDINTDIYREMVDDIREADPDILVIKMECRDNEDVLYSMIGQEEQGLLDYNDFRDIINLFHDDLRDVRQVLWIHDSVGTSSTIALSWPELYMTPEARFGGLVSQRLGGFENWADADVRGKMTAAFMSMIKGYLEYGDQSLDLAEAMIRPSFKLSGTWKGREVVWTLDTSGEYIVDNSERETANFRSKVAEDLCISDGTAESLDDLALLLGIREYRMAGDSGEEIFKDYTEDWRRRLENCRQWLIEYEENIGYASGEDELAYLGRAKSNLEKILAAMERYKAVEIRLGIEYQIRKFDLVTWIELLRERILALRQSRRGGGGGRGGGRGGGPPGSGGGGNPGG